MLAYVRALKDLIPEFPPAPTADEPEKRTGFIRGDRFAFPDEAEVLYEHDAVLSFFDRKMFPRQGGLLPRGR